MCFYFIFNVGGNIIGEADDVLSSEEKNQRSRCK